MIRGLASQNDQFAGDDPLCRIFGFGSQSGVPIFVEKEVRQDDSKDDSERCGPSQVKLDDISEKVSKSRNTPSECH